MLLRQAIGATIRNERTMQKRSLRDIAYRSHMSLGYLSEIERGKKEVSSEVLEAICESLFMSTKDLLIETIVSMENYQTTLENTEKEVFVNV